MFFLQNEVSRFKATFLFFIQKNLADPRWTTEAMYFIVFKFTLGKIESGFKKLKRLLILAYSMCPDFVQKTVKFF